ncbi:MAG: amidohydrolase family protein, partial [Christensenellaceae bacterium]
NCELIADTIHVSVPAIQLLVKCKHKDKLTLITDAMRAKGLADGESELGGQVVIVKNGEARLKDGTLAGSVLRMNRAIANLVEKVGVAFLQAVDYATINPARTLGIDGETGSIRVGKRRISSSSTISSPSTCDSRRENRLSRGESIIIINYAHTLFPLITKGAALIPRLFSCKGDKVNTVCKRCGQRLKRGHSFGERLAEQRNGAAILQDGLSKAFR